jgi:hypothetical protein
MINLFINFYLELKIFILNSENKYKTTIYLSVYSVCFIFTIYKLIFTLSLLELIMSIISFLISFSITHFILNKFTISNYWFIKYIQYSILISLIFIFGYYICDFLNIQLINVVECQGDDTLVNSQDNKSKNILSIQSETDDNSKQYYSFKADKNFIDKGINAVGIGVKTVIQNTGLSIGAASAAGVAASTVLKSTSGMPPVQRALLVGGMSAATAAGTTLGLKTGKILGDNINADIIKNSAHADPNINRIPSPDLFVANSPLESNDVSTPLEQLLGVIVSYQMLELFLLFLLFFLLFIKFFYKKNTDLVSLFVNKFMPNKFVIWYNNIMQWSTDFNDKFNTILFIFISILFILIKLGNIYACTELYSNIDTFVSVYNYYKGIK